MEIRNSHDLRIAYEVLSLIEEIKEQQPQTAALADKHIISQKKEIRRFLNQKPSERKIAFSYSDDSWIELIKLPVKDISEAEEYFMENVWIPYMPSPYDCTGQWFSRWFKVFERRGDIYAYHAICVDV